MSIKIKIESKGIKSIRSRVANIAEFLNEEMTMEEFKEHVVIFIFDVDDVKDVPQYELTEEDWKTFTKFLKIVIKNGNGTYGKSPAYNFKLHINFLLAY